MSAPSMTTYGLDRPESGDDVVVPFTLDTLDARGRVVRLGPALDGILNRHNYPAPVARLLGEAVVLAALIGSSLKFAGRFILQTQTDGPVNLIVVDLDAPDGLRGVFVKQGAEDVERKRQRLRIGLRDPCGQGFRRLHALPPRPARRCRLGEDDRGGRTARADLSGDRHASHGCPPGVPPDRAAAMRRLGPSGHHRPAGHRRVPVERADGAAKRLRALHRTPGDAAEPVGLL